MDQITALRQQLVKNLNTSEAHADYDKTVKDMPFKLQGIIPEGAEHSAWQLLEHLRITMHDLLEFSRNPSYESPRWPEGYWPKTPAPPDESAWNQSIKSFHQHTQAMVELVEDQSTDLFAKIPHGEGQTILREVLLAIDHNAYHLGQLILVRRLLGAWK